MQPRRTENAFRSVLRPVRRFSTDEIAETEANTRGIKWTKPGVQKPAWIRLEGFKRFASKKDVEHVLDGLLYEKVEALVDHQLAVTGMWAVKLSADSQSFEEIQNITSPKRQPKNISIFSVNDIEPLSKIQSALASLHNLDNRCIKIMNTGVPLTLDLLCKLFEGFQLDPYEPLKPISNTLPKFVPNPNQSPVSQPSLKYVVRFASSLEAERAVFEKCFTPIGGVKSVFFWYDI